jgi:hypothetical protein
MDDHDDLHHGTLEDILAKRRRRAIRNGLIALAVLGIIGAVAWTMLREPAPHSPAPQPIRVEPVAESEPPAPAPPAPAPEPIADEPLPEPEPLPVLDESDSLVRSVVAALSRRHELAAWLVTEDLIRRFVAATDSIAEGKSPREQVDMMWPKQKFKVIEREESIVVDPASYGRYNAIADVLVSLDTKGTVALYRRLKPLIAEAHRDLGYPDRNFDDTLTAAFWELLRAPVVVGDATLSTRILSYDYADSQLEGMSAAQKQLLRMGPTNVPRVQKKLRELARELGIPERDLPNGGIYKVKPADPLEIDPNFNANLQAEIDANLEVDLQATREATLDVPGEVSP